MKLGSLERKEAYTPIFTDSWDNPSIQCRRESQDVWDDLKKQFCNITNFWEFPRDFQEATQDNPIRGGIGQEVILYNFEEYNDGEYFYLTWLQQSIIENEI